MLNGAAGKRGSMLGIPAAGSYLRVYVNLCMASSALSQAVSDTAHGQFCSLTGTADGPLLLQAHTSRSSASKPKSLGGLRGGLG